MGHCFISSHRQYCDMCVDVVAVYATWPSAKACPVGVVADENVDVMAVYATAGRVLRPAQWALWPMRVWM